MYCSDVCALGEVVLVFLGDFKTIFHSLKLSALLNLKPYVLPVFISKRRPGRLYLQSVGLNGSWVDSKIMRTAMSTLMCAQKNGL